MLNNSLEVLADIDKSVKIIVDIKNLLDIIKAV